MSSDKRFGLLRNVLRAIGLSQTASDQVVDFIVDLLAGENKDESTSNPMPEFPYHLRDHFLSPAEQAFFDILRQAVGNRAVLNAKVALNDIFYVNKDDYSRYRIYTNKIDRKHVDFLLCDPVTMQPVVGIELDDRSHQREDRQERDHFVDGVFSAGDLPLLHMPVRRAYVSSEIEEKLAPFLEKVVRSAVSEPAKQPAQPASAGLTSDAAPRCPKCGGEMLLRTAKSGPNAGNKFWGCSNYPTCRSMLPYEGVKA